MFHKYNESVYVICTINLLHVSSLDFFIRRIFYYKLQWLQRMSFVKMNDKGNKISKISLRLRFYVDLSSKSCRESVKLPKSVTNLLYTWKWHPRISYMWLRCYVVCLASGLWILLATDKEYGKKKILRFENPSNWIWQVWIAFSEVRTRD